MPDPFVELLKATLIPRSKYHKPFTDNCKTEDRTEIKTKTMSDTESTAWTALTPPESVVTNEKTENINPKNTEPDLNTSSVPWPGSTYIISSVESNAVITFKGGKIILAPPGGFGTFRWECVERNGWLGFRDHASGRYLGFEKNHRICCKAEKHVVWESFVARPRPDGKYVLLCTHGHLVDNLAPVVKLGKDMLEKKDTKISDAVVWNFVKV